MNNSKAFIEMAKKMHFHTRMKRTNYPFGVNSKSVTTVTCKDCGSLLKKED